MSILSKSFERLTVAVDSTTTAWRLIIAMLLVHSGLLMYSAYVHSPTLNEPGHLVAGLSHWEFGRFELYRVNPPLVRMVATLPVMAIGYEEDWSGFMEAAGARPASSIGANFVTQNGKRSYFLFMIARWACIPFSLLGAVVCYLWARDLSGRPAGLVACLLWCLSPTILAHASLVTADAGGAAFGAAACYTFWRWLKKPTWAYTVLTGCTLGLAELAKTTLILFYPLWPVLWLVYRLPRRHFMLRRDWIREAGMLALRMIIGLYVLNLGYGFEGSFKRLGEFEFISQLFTGSNEDTIALETISGNRFRGTLMSHVPMPFPKNYIVGIDIQQKDFENYPRPSYLRGEWRDYGWWYYYLYAGGIKVPLGTLVLALFSLCVTCCWFGLRKHDAIFCHATNDLIQLLAPLFMILFVVSLKSGFSEHFRYALPCFPFFFIWISSVSIQAKSKLHSLPSSPQSMPTRRPKLGSRPLLLLKPLVVSFLIVWSVISSLCIFPHSLSYFNESIGGPLNGSDHLLGSSVDWGQDLRYLETYLNANKSEVAPLGNSNLQLAYYGYLDPRDLGIKHALPQNISPGDANKILIPGVHAISENFVCGSPWVAVNQEGGFTFFKNGALTHYRLLKPSHRAGYSISVFHVNYF